MEIIIFCFVLLLYKLIINEFWKVYMYSVGIERYIFFLCGGGFDCLGRGFFEYVMFF